MEQSNLEFTTYDVRFSCLVCGNVGNTIMLTYSSSLWVGNTYPYPNLITLALPFTMRQTFAEVFFFMNSL